MQTNSDVCFGNQEVRNLLPAMNRISRTVLALAVVCGVVACAAAPRKSEAERQADAEMVNKVQLALNGDQELFARHITVRADGAVVQLGGYVWTLPELEDAIRVAGLVPGVEKVVSSLELDRGGLSNSSVSR
jgi:osmotically-inducible protein OsmY